MDGSAPSLVGRVALASGFCIISLLHNHAFALNTIAADNKSKKIGYIGMLIIGKSAVIRTSLM